MEGYLALEKQTATQADGSGKEAGVGAGSCEQVWVSRASLGGGPQKGG